MSYSLNNLNGFLEMWNIICSNAAQHIASMKQFTTVRSLKKCFYGYLEELDTSGKCNTIITIDISFLHYVFIMYNFIYSQFM